MPVESLWVNVQKATRLDERILLIQRTIKMLRGALEDHSILSLFVELERDQMLIGLHSLSDQLDVIRETINTRACTLALCQQHALPAIVCDAIELSKCEYLRLEEIKKKTVNGVDKK